MSTITDTFVFPKYFHFRPFFTLQPVSETRDKQLKMWRELVLSYHEHHGLYTLSTATRDALFRNPEIDRFLSSDAVDAVIAALLSHRDAEWEDAETRTTLLIYWRPPEALARDVHSWALQRLSRFDAVLPIADLIGDADATTAAAATTGKRSDPEVPFEGVHPAIMIKALELLEAECKCAIIDGLGVKFAV